MSNDFSMRGYTFVGNVKNCNLDADALSALADAHPKFYRYFINSKEYRAAQARHDYMFRGLRTAISLDAIDIYGKAIKPRGHMLAMYVCNADMGEYNRRYLVAMSQGV